MWQRFLFFCAGLASLLLFDVMHRRVVMYGISFGLILMSVKIHRNWELIGFIAMAIFHSAVHVWYPFLDDDAGFSFEYSPFLDVLCHAMMLAWVWLISSAAVTSKYYELYNKLSVGAFIGSLGNVGFAMTGPWQGEYDVAFVLFHATSVFQAISTGYWIAVMLAYPHFSDNKYLCWWGAIIGIILGNFFAYNLSHPLLAFAMHSRYIEALFIVSSWMPCLTVPVVWGN